MASGVTPNPQYGMASAKLAGLIARSSKPIWKGIVYRYVVGRYADESRVMSGDGAFKSGGRWNAPGTFHTVYCSSSADLAQREYFASNRRAGIPDHARMPLAGLAIELKGMRALNLWDKAVQSVLGVTLAHFMADDWKGANDRGDESFCQSIGRAARDAGYEALLIPSAESKTSGEYNIVVIVENCAPDRWKVLRDERAP